MVEQPAICAFFFAEINYKDSNIHQGGNHHHFIHELPPSRQLKDTPGGQKMLTSNPRESMYGIFTYIDP